MSDLERAENRIEATLMSEVQYADDGTAMSILHREDVRALQAELSRLRSVEKAAREWSEATIEYGEADPEIQDKRLAGAECGLHAAINGEEAKS